MVDAVHAVPLAAQPAVITLPSLAIVIPLLAADRQLLPGLLEAIAAQAFQPTEVIIATDTTLDTSLANVPELPLLIVRNPGQVISCGLNVAIKATACESIIRFDVRARPAPDYVARCLAALEAGAEVVGGQLFAVPSAHNAVSEAISVAVTHPLGAGDARYRIGGRKGPVDTVPYPCFRRELWERLGGYNETLGANEDYEFNWRVRQAGGQIVFDPMIRCGYLARESFGQLARQYFRYGWWKLQMLRQHPRSMRSRQLIPLLIPASFAITLFASDLWPVLLPVALGYALVYFVTLAITGLLFAITRGSPSLVWTLPVAFVTIHTAWSSGAWINLLSRGRWPFR